MQLTYEVKHGVKKFLSRLGFQPGEPGSPQVLANSTEEVLHDLDRGKTPKLYGMTAGQPVIGRLEENYLYSTRRFPLNITNNTIGSGAVAAQDYLYFVNGIGDPGAACGYFSLSNLTLQQTNMANGGKIPSGRGFRLYELGITFNAMAVANDVAQMLDIANLRFEKQNQSLVVQHGPIKFWPGGMGLYGFASTTQTTTTIQGAANGMPAITNSRRFRNPRVLSSNEQFQYVLNASANLPRDNAAVALVGFVEVTVWLFGQVLDTIPS